jgi:hypothetical protein
MTRPMTKEEFLAAWRRSAPPRREELELAPLTPRQRADVMVEIHRLSFNATKALLKAKGIRLPHNEMVVVARVYLAGFREAQRPEVMHRPFAELAYFALKEAWPCKP